MRILIIGANGTIGREVVKALAGDHEIIRASRSGADMTVDIRDVTSIEAMYVQAGRWTR